MAEVTRHAPTLIVDGTLGLLAQRGAAAPPPWQQLEAALFAAQAAAEPYLVQTSRETSRLPGRRPAESSRQTSQTSPFPTKTSRRLLWNVLWN